MFCIQVYALVGYVKCERQQVCCKLCTNWEKWRWVRFWAMPFTSIAMINTFVIDFVSVNA